MQSKFATPTDEMVKLRELFKIISIALLVIHFYGYCHILFEAWHLTAGIVDRLFLHLLSAPFLRNYFAVKLLVIAAMIFSFIGIKAKEKGTFDYQRGTFCLFIGATLYFFAAEVLKLDFALSILYYAYAGLTLSGYILLTAGVSIFAKAMAARFLNNDVFNTRNETFPQEERFIGNEYSINLPAAYNLQGRRRGSWINITNPFRGLLILGTPGSGKTYFIIQNIIEQHIQKGFALFVYDFKYPDLSTLTYNYYLKYRQGYSIQPEFYVIDFERTMHRCNPIDTHSMHDITDAAESARTILLGLNRAWIKKQGDFWVESPINFLTALIWYLRLYQEGRYCTLAHVIELIQIPYDKLFSILRMEPQVESLIMPFVTAYLNSASAQLEGQVAGATISLGKLSSPNLYYVLSGNDFTLDINNPEKPKIVCMGNNPQKANIYGAVLSLYITELTRQLNKRKMQKSSIIFDEFPSIYFNGIDNLMATARSNKVATTLAVQDASQLKLHYGKEQAEVIINIVGNIISGQVSGETAKQLAERFGKILQEKQTVSVNDYRTSVANSTQLEMAIPQSTISSLSSGEFVGMVADDPQQKILLKKFHCEITRENRHPKGEQATLKKLPEMNISQQEILDNYLQIKKDIQLLINEEMERMLNDPLLRGLLVKPIMHSVYR